MKLRGRNARHYMGIALSVGLAATAGCQAAKPTAPDETVLRTGSQPASTATGQVTTDLGLTKMPISPNQLKLLAPGNKPITNAVVTVGGQIVRPDEAGNITIPPSALNAAGLAFVTVEAPGYVPQMLPVVGGAALPMVPIDPARTSISAAAGGIARSSDGTMEVSFAPGSIDKDAQVAVTRTYSDALATYFMPKPAAGVERISLGNYSYNLELGGAKVTEAANVIVKFKVEGKLKAHFDALLNGGGGLEASNIADEFSRDNDGTMWFSMKKPAANAAPAFVESMPKPTFGLLAVSCPQYPNDHWWRTDRIVRVNQTTGNCTNTSDGGVDIHHNHPQWNNGSCLYIDDPTYQCEPGRQLVQYVQTRVSTPSSGIVAKVRWSSDDGRITGPVPAATVYFAHAGTRVRSATTQDNTDADGEASGHGAEGVTGQANVLLNSQPWTKGTSGGYTVNCGAPVLLDVIKNKPKVKFNFNRQGDATPAAYDIRTSHGNYSVPNLNGPTVPVTMDSITSATETFNVAGSWQADSNSTWIDAQSTANHTIQWNNYNQGNDPNAVETKIWFSKQIGTTLKYLSNDATSPVDQTPDSLWSNRSAIANVAFNHAVSSYGAKAHPDTLGFTGADGQAGTWGLNGATGSVTATVTGTDSPTPVVLTGSKNYTIAGNQVETLINANLPDMTVTIREMETEDTQFKLIYLLDGDEKTMILNRNGSTIKFSIPVEDAINVPRKHTFQIRWFGSTNGNTTFWMANRAAFPTIVVARAGVYDHPALDGTLNAAK